MKQIMKDVAEVTGRSQTLTFSLQESQGRTYERLPTHKPMSPQMAVPVPRHPPQGLQRSKDPGELSEQLGQPGQQRTRDTLVVPVKLHLLQEAFWDLPISHSHLQLGLSSCPALALAGLCHTGFLPRTYNL